MGPMSLCVASYLPFSVNCFMNGHSYVAGNCGGPQSRSAWRTMRSSAVLIPTC